MSNPQSSKSEWEIAATIKPIRVTSVCLTATNLYRREQDIGYSLADVFKEVVVDLRKGFNLFA